MRNNVLFNSISILIIIYFLGIRVDYIFGLAFMSIVNSSFLFSHNFIILGLAISIEKIQLIINGLNSYQYIQHYNEYILNYNYNYNLIVYNIYKFSINISNESSLGRINEIGTLLLIILICSMIFSGSNYSLKSSILIQVLYMSLLFNMSTLKLCNLCIYIIIFLFVIILGYLLI